MYLRYLFLLCLCGLLLLGLLFVVLLFSMQVVEEMLCKVVGKGVYEMVYSQ